jgi:hypothetical protein
MKVKVKFLPPSPKAGTIEALPYPDARTLKNAGFVEILSAVERPRYGTPEWQQERKELDAQRIPLGTDAAIPFYAVPQWSVQTLRAGGDPVYVIEKLSGCSERTLYRKENPRVTDAAFIDSMKKAGCPSGIVQQYLSVLPAQENSEAVVEALVQQRYKNDAAQQVQRERETAGWYRVTGGQK